MKKLIVFAVALSVVAVTHAGLVNWSSTNFVGDAIGDTLESGWFVAMYWDTNNNNTASWYNELQLDTNGVVQSSGVTQDDQLLAYSTSIIAVPATLITINPLSTNILPNNIEVYTVVFNNATIADATQFVVMDSSTFNVGAVAAPNTPIDYNLMSIAGEWQDVIPEPAVVGLIVVFGGGMLAVRRIFFKS